MIAMRLGLSLPIREGVFFWVGACLIKLVSCSDLDHAKLRFGAGM